VKKVLILLNSLEEFKSMIEETARKIAENEVSEVNAEFCKFCKALKDNVECKKF
jgi:hypothetical protein